MMPLQGYKVLDVTQFLSGPICCSILADMGAEVIKFENPNQGGDTTRYQHPVIDGKSSYFMSANRGKKSVFGDFKNEKIRELFLKMVADADIVVENFRPGTMDKLGIGYEELKKRNPRIILTSISGYGQKGPWAKRGAFDMAVQAACGIMSLTGEPGSGPMKVGVSISDVMGSVWGAIGTMAAVINRDRFGKGTHVDIAMMDAMMSIEDVLISRYLFDGQVPKQSGNKHPLSAPFMPCECIDGDSVMVCASTQPQFDLLCNVLKHPELSRDDRFLSKVSRARNRKELEPIIEKIIREEWMSDDLCDALEASGLPYSRINNIEQVVNLEQVKVREMIANIHYSGCEDVFHSCASPVHMEGFERITDYHISGPGEDTFDILAPYATQEELHSIFDPYFEVLPNIIEKSLR